MCPPMAERVRALGIHVRERDRVTLFGYFKMKVGKMAGIDIELTLSVSVIYGMIWVGLGTYGLD